MHSFFRRFPLTGPERKREIGRLATKVRELRRLGLRAHYGYLDSPLIGKWKDDESYETTFRKLVPDGKEAFISYIMRNMAHTVPKKGMIVVDAGGPGRQIAEGLRRAGTNPENEWAIGVRRSLGVTLEDIEKTKAGEDRLHGHTVMEGNLMTEQTEKRIDTWLKGEQIDLFFERLCGGVEALPNEPVFLAQKLNRWYERMAEGGIMFIETPVVMNRFIEAWGKMLQEQFAGYLEVNYKLGNAIGIPGEESAVLIRKLPGAPSSLPLLDLKTTRGIAKHENKLYEANRMIPPAAPEEEEQTG